MKEKYYQLCQMLFNRLSKTGVENQVLDLAVWRSLMKLTRSIWLNDRDRKPDQNGFKRKCKDRNWVFSSKRNI